MTGRMRTAAAILAVLALGGCRSTGPAPSAGTNNNLVPKTAAGRSAKPGGKKLVYPWSVVAGGVDSSTAMREAMQADPVVLAHYAGLEPGNFRVETLQAPRQGFVSFRVRDKVYWTKRLVTLQAGETVLTDGQTMLRGRCGNMVSPAPREPQAAADFEPAEIAMDSPVRAQELELPPFVAAAPPAAAETFVNPKQLGDNPEVISSMLPPSPLDSLPPAWVTGGVTDPGGGFFTVGNTGGGTPSTPSTSAPAPPPAVETLITAPALVPAAIPSTPIEITPPMITTSLLFMPETPNSVTPGVLPVVYSFSPPQSFYHPPASPPQQAPPVTNPPTNIPSTPPTIPPGGNPPPGNPPGQPPSGPPPALPPSSDPPALPPLEPPPDVSVPEPSAWVLFALGIAGIAIGSFRRKRG